MKRMLFYLIREKKKEKKKRQSGGLIRKKKKGKKKKKKSLALSMDLTILFTKRPLNNIILKLKTSIIRSLLV